MTKFENPSFSSGANSNAYRDGWQRTFGRPTDVKCQKCSGQKLDSSNIALCKKCISGASVDPLGVDGAVCLWCGLPFEEEHECNPDFLTKCFSCGENKRSIVSSNPVCSDCEEV